MRTPASDKIRSIKLRPKKYFQSIVSLYYITIFQVYYLNSTLREWKSVCSLSFCVQTFFRFVAIACHSVAGHKGWCVCMCVRVCMRLHPLLTFMTPPRRAPPRFEPRRSTPIQLRIRIDDTKTTFLVSLSYLCWLIHLSILRTFFWPVGHSIPQKFDRNSHKSATFLFNLEMNSTRRKK